MNCPSVLNVIKNIAIKDSYFLISDYLITLQNCAPLMLSTYSLVEKTQKPLFNERVLSASQVMP